MLSTLHVTIWQGALLDAAPWFDRAKARRPVLAYRIVADISSFPSDLSFPTAYRTHGELAGTVLPAPDFDKLVKEKGDDNWVVSAPPAD